MTALTTSRDVFETFFEHARTGLALADLSARYVRVNAAYADLVGCPPEELVGVRLSAVLHPDDRSRDDALVADLLTGRAPTVSSEQRYVGPDGAVRWVLHGVAAVPDAAGRPTWLAVSAQDITERRRAEQELRDLTATLTERAVRDPLTGLANRALLEERLAASLARDGRSGGTTGVLFLDLDGFKDVNDRHGHGVGDAVLRGVAVRLQSAVRPGDTVARLGGDEFVVLAESTDRAGLAALSDRLVAAVARPLQVGRLRLTVGVSVGAASSTAGESDAASLLATADRRMYAVKRARRS